MGCQSLGFWLCESRGLDKGEEERETGIESMRACARA